MSTSKKKETYSQAMERLEKIVRQIDNNELEITNTLRYERNRLV